MEFMDSATKEHFLKLSPGKRLGLLRDYCRSLEIGPALVATQKLLFDLELEEQQYSAMKPHNLARPTDFDVVINNIT